MSTYQHCKSSTSSLKKPNISPKFPSDGNDWSPRKCKRTLKWKAAAVACRDTLLPSFQHNYMLITSEEFENKQAAAFNEAFIAVRTMKKHLKQLISSSIQALFHFQRQLRGEIGCHPVWVYKEAEKEIMAEVCAFFPHVNLIIFNVWSDFEEHETKKPQQIFPIMHFKNLKRALQSLPVCRAASDFSFYYFGGRCRT